MNTSSLNCQRNDDFPTKSRFTNNDPDIPQRSTTCFSQSIMKEIQDSKEKFREQLKGLVQFVEKVEEQTPSDWEMVSITPLTSERQSYCSSPSLTMLDQGIPKSGAIQDCFKIIMSFLRETKLLFNELADEIDNKHNLYSNSTTEFDVYFTQYQLQLVFFICTTLCMQIDHCNIGMMKWIKENFSRLPETNMDVFSYAMHHRFTVVGRKCDPEHSSDLSPVQEQEASRREYDDFYLATLQNDGESPQDLESHQESHLTLRTPNLGDLNLRGRLKYALNLLVILSQKIYNWLHVSEKGSRGHLKSISPEILPDKICLDCALKLFKSNEVLCNPCRRSIVTYSKLQDILTSPIDGDIIPENVSQQTETFELNGIFNLNTLAKKVKKGIDKYIENKIEVIDQSDLCVEPTDYGESDKIINILMEGFKEASLDPSSYRLTRSASDSDFLKSHESRAKLFTAEPHDADFAFDSSQIVSPLTEEEQCEQFVEDSIRKAAKKLKVLRMFRKNVSAVEEDMKVIDKPAKDEKLKEQNGTKDANENPEDTKNSRESLKGNGNPDTRDKNVFPEPKILVPEDNKKILGALLGSDRPIKSDLLEENVESTLKLAKEVEGVQRQVGPSKAAKSYENQPTEEKKVRELIEDEEAKASSGSPKQDRNERQSIKAEVPDLKEKKLGKAELREFDSHGMIKISTIAIVDEFHSHIDKWEKNVLNILSLDPLVRLVDEEDMRKYLVDLRCNRLFPPKQSAAVTHLEVVDYDVLDTSRAKHLRTTSHENILKKKERQPRRPRYDEKKHLNLVTKVWHLYGQLQEEKKNSGCPLYIKVRHGLVEDDAFHLLTVDSEHKLNYYRFIKVFINVDLDYIEKDGEKVYYGTDHNEEFYDILSNTLFSTRAKGLFRFPNELNGYLSPNPDCRLPADWFKFAGTVLALSIVHQTPLRALFPTSVIKNLLGRTVEFEDLRKLNSSLYNKLMLLRKIPIIPKRLLTTVDPRDTTMKASLLEDKYITQKNKNHYIQHALQWEVIGHCFKEMTAMKRGFDSVLDPSLLEDFTAEEMQEICYKVPNEIGFVDHTAVIRSPEPEQYIDDVFF